MSLQIKTKKTKRWPKSPSSLFEAPKELSFLDHLVELRNRFMVVAIAIGAGAMLAYVFQKPLINLLIQPAHGQHFIYTSPIGGVGFVFSLTTDFGIFLAIPIIIYELLSFISPALKKSTKKSIFHYALASGVLAVIGVSCGYYFGLPLVLGFLTHPFATKQIQPLFTITEYLSFVSYYLFAAAMIMQIPIILMFINRITPLKPQKLFHYERHVIVLAFIISAIMAPTINLLDLFLIAGPIIVVYNLAILIIWRLNIGYQAKNRFKNQDLEAQQKRQSVQSQASPILTTSPGYKADSSTITESDDRPPLSGPRRRIIDVVT